MPKPVSKTRLILTGIFVLLFAGVVLAVVLRLTSQSPGPGSGPAVQNAASERPRADTSAPASKKPAETPGQLVISASAETGPNIYASRPLVISANLWRKALIPDPQGNLPSAEPIVIKAKTGSWQDALVVDVRNSAGEAVAWPLHPMPANPSDNSLTLKVDDFIQAYWFLDPSVTETLKPGAYTIAVSFDRARVEGLPEYVAFDRFHVTVEKEPPVKIPETQKQLEEARFALFKKELETAEKKVDQVLSQNPENLEGISLKAGLLAEKGNKPEAVNLLNNALMIYYRKFPDADPPLSLIQQRGDLLKDMAPQAVKSEGNTPP